MPDLKKGSTGPEVVKIQKALATGKIKPVVKPNGKFDAKTEEAVKAFQKKNKLKEDGIVGKKTMPKLMALGKGPKMDLKMTAPKYGDLLKKETKEFVATKKRVLKVLVEINRDPHKEIKKIAKEYNHFFQLYVTKFNEWRERATKADKAQAQFLKELRNDPWTAQEIKKSIDTLHAAAHFDLRVMQTCKDGCARLNKELEKARGKILA